MQLRKQVCKYVRFKTTGTPRFPQHVFVRSHKPLSSSARTHRHHKMPFSSKLSPTIYLSPSLLSPNLSVFFLLSLSLPLPISISISYFSRSFALSLPSLLSLFFSPSCSLSLSLSISLTVFFAIARSLSHSFSLFLSSFFSHS